MTDPTAPQTALSVPVGKIAFGLFFGLVVTVAIGVYADAQQLMASITDFSVHTLIAVLSLTALNWALRFMKWHGYLRILQTRPRLSDSLWVFVAGFSMGVTPGKFGEVLKAWLLHERSNIPVTTTASVVIAERLTDFIALVLLASFGVYATGYGAIVMGVACAGSILSIAILSSPSLSIRIIRMTANMPVLNRLTDKLEALYRATAALVRPGPLVLALIVSVAAWGCECYGFYLVLSGISDAPPQLSTCTFIYSFATIFGAITLLPGGLGTTEGSLVGLVHTVFAMAPKQVAGAAALIIRFCTLWAAVLVGLLVLLLFRRQRTPE